MTARHVAVGLAVAAAAICLLGYHLAGMMPLLGAVWVAFAPLSFLRRLTSYAFVLLVQVLAIGLQNGAAVAHVAAVAQLSLIVSCPLLFVRECVGPISRRPIVTRRGVRSLLYVVALNAFVVWLICGNGRSPVVPSSLAVVVLLALAAVSLCSGAGPLRFVLGGTALAGAFGLERHLATMTGFALSDPRSLVTMFVLLCVPLAALRLLGYRLWGGTEPVIAPRELSAA